MKKTKLYVPRKATDNRALEKLIGGKLNIKHRSHWNDILRLIPCYGYIAYMAFCELSS